MKKRILQLCLVAAVVAIAVIAFQKDGRLIGTYLVDGDDTATRWTLAQDGGPRAVKGAVYQIFQAQPVVFTSSVMKQTASTGKVTRHYWVLWKGTSSCIIATSRLIFFRIDFTPDGLWMTRKWAIPREKYPMIFNLDNIENLKDADIQQK